MIIKVVEITSCTSCKYEGWDGKCTLTRKKLSKGIGIPDWCLLPDAPITNQSSGGDTKYLPEISTESIPFDEILECPSCHATGQGEVFRR